MMQIVCVGLWIALGMGWVTSPLLAEARVQTVIHNDHQDLEDFLASLASQGVAIEWQATGTSVNWQFTLYRSQNCQFDGAEEVSAPIFSSINDENQVAHYSLTDAETVALSTCGYWLQATESSGAKQQFGPYKVHGLSTVYLPLAAR